MPFEVEQRRRAEGDSLLRFALGAQGARTRSTSSRGLNGFVT
jgi:hypothetical protein